MTSSTHDLSLTARQWGVLLTLGDVLIPADEFPSASAAGLRAFFEHNAGDFGEPVWRRIVAGLDALAGIDFDGLPADKRQAIVALIESDDAAMAWPEPASRWLQMMLSIVAQSYYSDPANGGNAEGASWRMVGFDPAPKRTLPSHRDFALTITPVSQVRAEYDAIVVGSGAGGGIAAQVLAEAGLQVLLIERGQSLRHVDVGRDHLRNHRYPAYGHNTGPAVDGHPRVFESGGRLVISRPHEQRYSNNAMTVGGGTRVYGAQAWRFVPQDFRMASVYGAPEGSGLTDWPIDYDELAPWYARAEREIGVAGELGHAHQGAREPYPMPPFPLNADGRVLRGTAEQLGWRTAAIPLAVNTVAYNSRPACVRCGTCVGFSCPSNSKNDTHNTAIPRALATGRCHLLTAALVGSLVCDSDGQARGVHVFVEDGETVVERTVHARTIVVCAGAIETARLLLNSRSRLHPAGLGNQHDQVGRHLQGHLYSGAVGLYHDLVQDCEGPGVSIATCEFNHGNPGVIGGGLLGNEFVPLPIHFWSAFAPMGARWGLAGKRFFADAYRRTLVVMGPIQEIPNPHARVTVDADVRDRFGLPVARLSGEVHPESVRAAAMLRTKAEAWLRSAGVTALRSWGGDHRGVLSAGQHQAGTCRMGDDPVSSVTDRNGRVHGQCALFIADGSLHVTNGGFNPVLTIMANAYRIADGIVARIGT